MRTITALLAATFVASSIPSATAMLSMVPVDSITPAAVYDYNEFHEADRMMDVGSMEIKNAVGNGPFSFAFGLPATTTLDAVQIFNGGGPGGYHTGRWHHGGSIVFKNAGGTVLDFNISPTGESKRLVYTFPQIDADEMVLTINSVGTSVAPKEGWLQVREVFFNGTDDFDTVPNPDGSAGGFESEVVTAVPEPSAALLSFVFLMLGLRRRR